MSSPDASGVAVIVDATLLLDAGLLSRPVRDPLGDQPG